MKLKDTPMTRNYPKVKQWALLLKKSPIEKTPPGDNEQSHDPTGSSGGGGDIFMWSIRFGTIGGRANYIVWTRDICMHTEEGNTVIIDRAAVDRLPRRQHSV